MKITRVQKGTFWIEFAESLSQENVYWIRNKLNPVWEEGTAKSFFHDLSNCLYNGWKYAVSGFDPNDTFPNVGDELDNFWNSGGGGCCKGVNGTGPMKFANGKWHNEDCGTLRESETVSSPAPVPSPAYVAPKFNPCECGAWATSNPNCHSFWCKEHKK